MITPPLWKGSVALHVIVLGPPAGDKNINAELLMALVDLGLIDARDAGFIGYPSGDPG